MDSKDPIFEEEQQHLSDTYRKICDIEETSREQIETRMKQAKRDRAELLSDLGIDYGNGADVDLETAVELEMLNSLIDSYNLSNEVDAQRLKAAVLLKDQPYFAKVSLQLRPDAPVRDIYIGPTGLADDNYRHFIIDWRSPIAETYYNQENGKTSYRANGRTIECDLKLRRQFDITGSTLNSYFDTTVAIEDSLLLASLKRTRSAQLQNITATIQREQNVVVRHEDVPALLVNGIAGSGKTSVLLQRIAYLFYQERENLEPRDVYLITPNQVFQHYIANVLPDMGESNPQTLTWNDLMETMGLSSHGLGKDHSGDTLRRIDELLPSLRLEPNDFQDIRIGEERVIKASQARAAYESFKRFPAGVHRSTLVIEELHEKLQQRIKNLSNDESTQDSLYDLSDEEQMRLFGQVLNAYDEPNLKECAHKYLIDRYAQVEDAIEDGAWLRIDRIGMRMLGTETLSAAEWLYLKLALAGGNNRSARYVMIDEVQDYTKPQLMVLARYFCNAHFLLLGDPNQAIKPNTATFEEIRDIFASAKGEVRECQLMTSYRSSPEITKLFASLMDSQSRMEVASVQREGIAARIQAVPADDYEQNLIAAINQAATHEEGLTAIIAPDKRSMKRLAKLLGTETNSKHDVPRNLASAKANEPLTQTRAKSEKSENETPTAQGASSRTDVVKPLLMDGTRNLPATGVLLMDIALAKGLEFDRVIIPDATPRSFDTSVLSKHRLYTAISRATQEVTILASEQLTHLLDDLD